jgi:carboxyl-terminal processing protease
VILYGFCLTGLIKEIPMRKFLTLFFIHFFALILLAQDSTKIIIPDLEPEPQHKRVTQLVAHILESNHYRKRELDDSLSSELYRDYLERLDYNRVYFLASDIARFEKDRYLLDDYIKAGYIQPAYDIFKVYEQRFGERLTYIYEHLDKEFDYSKDEYLEVDRKDAHWPKDAAEQQDLWRKYLKYEALNLKLAGKDWKGTVEVLRKRYDNLKRRVSQYESEDVFALFMDAFAGCFDPHTNYFSPKSFDNFKIAMSQSFEGIGARLQTVNEYTVVAEIIPGGPAEKTNQLFVNDKIIGVAQGDDGEIVDVVGWRIDDVVQLIRGKKNTRVRLQLLRAGMPVEAMPDTIAIVRDKVNIEDQSAKSDTLEIIHENQPFTFGVIKIPTFYSDFDGRRAGLDDYKSTTRDVRRLIKAFDPAKLDGLIIDLRHNGGGFLNEAVDLTGLFIDKGPVVQVKSSNGKVDVEWDDDAGATYSGPLAVLVDRMSASASEIFAAAIQDYDRGIIIGTQTFGKGTVQNAIDLNRFLKSPDVRLGQLKLTVAKFYRINGGSTQHVGVLPDITFPSRLTTMDIGESNSENALLWDQIAPVKYQTVGDVDDYIGDLELRHELRLKDDKDYQALLQDIEHFSENQHRKQISLNENTRRAERDKYKEDAPDEDDGEAEDSTAAAPVRKDLFLTEGAHILSDYILLHEKRMTGK